MRKTRSVLSFFLAVITAISLFATVTVVSAAKSYGDEIDTLQHRSLRRVQRTGGRQADTLVRDTRAPTGRQSRRNHRKCTERHHAAGDSALVSRCRRCAVRLLHTGHGDGDKGAAAAPSGSD